jgi:hypothetical protein
MAVKAKEQKKKSDPNYLGCFRVVLTDSVLSVVRSFQRIDSRLHGQKFGNCCKILEEELAANGKTKWKYYHFVSAKETRGRVDIPIEMVDAEFDMFVENNKSLRFLPIKDMYGLDVVKLYWRYGDEREE